MPVNFILVFPHLDCGIELSSVHIGNNIQDNELLQRCNKKPLRGKIYDGGKENGYTTHYFNSYVENNVNIYQVSLNALHTDVLHKNYVSGFLLLYYFPSLFGFSSCFFSPPGRSSIICCSSSGLLINSSILSSTCAVLTSIAASAECGCDG